LKVYQDPANPDHGYFSPNRGTIPDSFQDFTITILPCTVDSLVSAAAMPDVTYRIGDIDMTVGSYSFKE